MRKRFLYYVPGLSGCGERTLQTLGLRSRFVATGGQGCVEHGITITESGPANKSGILIGITGRPARYEPTKQTWVQSADGQFWVGLENTDMPPGPLDLVREVGIEGYQLVLGDKALWTIPRLRRWNRDRLELESALPKKLSPVDGKLKEIVNPRYQAHDAVAEKVWQSFVQEKTYQIEELYADCAGLLGMNYRVGVEEVGLLSLLDESLVLKLLGYCIDYPAIKEHADQRETDGLMQCEPTIEEEIS